MAPLTSVVTEVVAGQDPLVFWPNTAICKRCDQPFHKNRKDKLYCSPQCQDPNRYKNVTVVQSIRVYIELTGLDREQSLQQVVKVFEQQVGAPFEFRLENMPKIKLVASRPPEEFDPIEVENRIRRRNPDVVHAGETEAEWRARGGVPRVMPPGIGYIL